VKIVDGETSDTFFSVFDHYTRRNRHLAIQKQKKEVIKTHIWQQSIF